MKIWIEAFGFRLDPVSAEPNDRALALALDDRISLGGLLSLLDARFHVNTSDKTILVNGAYVPPNYDLQEGDRVQLLRMMNGG